MKELSRQVEAMKNGWDQSAVSHLERTLGELSRLLALKVSCVTCLRVSIFFVVLRGSDFVLSVWRSSLFVAVVVTLFRAHLSQQAST